MRDRRRKLYTSPERKADYWRWKAAPKSKRAMTAAVMDALLRNVAKKLQADKTA